LQKLRDNKLIFGAILAIISIFAVFPPVITATEIVVNKTVPASDYSIADVRAIFTMQKRFWPNKQQIKVYILSDNDLHHKDFVKNNLHMLPHQLRRIWDRLTYSGTGTAPTELESEREMIKKIATTPDSIGYLNSKPKSKPDQDNIRALEYH
jgi:ABC-type phosphate transport system substrate-binding protein